MSNLSDFFPGGSPTTGGGTIPDNISLNDLVDVSVTSPVNSEVLFYNGSIWVDKQLSYDDLEVSSLPNIPSILGNLNDVSVDAAADGQYLQYNVGSGLWIPSGITTVELNLNELLDVEIVSPTQAQTLIYNIPTASWVNSELGLDNLADVDTTTNPPTDGQLLTWDNANTSWVPVTRAETLTDRIEDDDNDTYVSVSEADDQVTVQAGPDNGYIMLKPNTTNDSNAAVVIDDGSGNEGSIEITGAGAEQMSLSGSGQITSSAGIDIVATTDVSIQGLTYPDTDGTNGQVITTDGNGVLGWSTGSGGGASSIGDLTDVDINGVEDNDILVWSTDKFITVAPGSAGPITFVDLTDTPADYTGSANKVVLVNATEDGLVYGDAPASALAGLTDTNISISPGTKFLKNVGGIWNDSSIVISDVNSLTTTLSNKLDGTSALSDLGNVSVPSPNNNDVLYWNNTAGQWQSKSPTAASTFIGLSDTPSSFGGTSGQMLVSNGSALIFTNVPSGGGVEEAPTDSKVYGRTNATWAEIVSGGGQSDRIQDADNNTYVSVSEVDDRVVIQAGPDDGNIMLKPNASVNNTAAVVIDNGSGDDAIISSTAGIDIIATNDISIQGLTYPSTDGTDGQVLSTDGLGTLSWADAASGGGGVSTFVELTDTPSNFSGANNFTVKVNAAGNALEFINVQPGEVNTASNLTGNEGIFASKNGSDLQFKSLNAGTNVTLTSNVNSITISSTDSGATTLDELSDVNTSGAQSGQVLTWNGTDTWTPTTISAGSASPLTTKGDIYTHNGSADARLPVGTNGQVLTADSATGTGVKWADAAGGGGGSNFESIKINYWLNTQIQNVSEQSAGITSATIIGGAKVDFEFAYNHPPTSITFYAYKDLGADGWGYKMTMPASSTQNHFVLTGGSAGSPAELLTNMSPGKIRMSLQTAETFADVNQHAYVFFTF